MQLSLRYFSGKWKTTH